MFRELQRWTPDTEIPQEDLELRGDRGWDQFAVNQQRFGVQSSYREDLYTTVIDRSGADYREKARRAAILAAEIEGVCFVLEYCV